MKMKFLIIILFASAFFSSCSDKKDPAGKGPAISAAPQYQLDKIEKMPVEESIKLPAQLAAFEEVSIFPKVNGYVKAVLVDIGSHVKPGQILMTLEAPELEQAMVQARERYARAKSGYTIDKENYERLKEASQTPGAISPQDLATAKGKMDADSALSNAEKANWEMQQTMIGYLTVKAPFNGVITQRNVHPGALVSAESKDKPMLELKQVNRLRLQLDIPEGIAAFLKNSDTVSFVLSAFPGKKFIGHVSRKSNNINAQYRSERFELDVNNPDGALAPGMYADVVLNAKGNPDAVAVPRSAVITSTERKYVLIAKDGKIHKVDVTTGNEGINKIEVFGQLQPGEEIVVNPNDEIKEGTAIR